MIEIGESNPENPLRVLIYSGAGIGKTTFAAKSDRPIFITPEGGIDRVTDANGNKVKFLKDMNSFDRILEGVQYLLKSKHDFKTLVIDSADWVENICHAKIIGSSGLDIIRVNKGYGAGFRESQRLHRELIERLDALRDARGMNLIFTAHAHVKPVNDPTAMAPYDRFEPKMHEMVSSLYREYVDAILFARMKVFTTEGGDNKARALTDGSRVVCTVEQPAFLAKNRFGLPTEMVFTEGYWIELMKYASRGIIAETAEELLAEIDGLLILIVDQELKKTVIGAIAKAGKDPVKLSPIRKRLKDITNA